MPDDGSEGRGFLFAAIVNCLVWGTVAVLIVSALDTGTTKVKRSDLVDADCRIASFETTPMNCTACYEQRPLEAGEVKFRYYGGYGEDSRSEQHERREFKRAKLLIGLTKGEEELPPYAHCPIPTPVEREDGKCQSYHWSCHSVTIKVVASGKEVVNGQQSTTLTLPRLPDKTEDVSKFGSCVACRCNYDLLLNQYMQHNSSVQCHYDPRNLPSSLVLHAVAVKEVEHMSWLLVLILFVILFGGTFGCYLCFCWDPSKELLPCWGQVAESEGEQVALTQDGRGVISYKSLAVNCDEDGDLYEEDNDPGRAVRTPSPRGGQQDQHYQLR